MDKNITQIEIKTNQNGFSANIQGNAQLLVDLLVVTMIKDKNFSLVVEEALKTYQKHQIMMN